MQRITQKTAEALLEVVALLHLVRKHQGRQIMPAPLVVILLRTRIKLPTLACMHGLWDFLNSHDQHEHYEWNSNWQTRTEFEMNLLKRPQNMKTRPHTGLLKEQFACRTVSYERNRPVLSTIVGCRRMIFQIFECHLVAFAIFQCQHVLKIQLHGLPRPAASLKEVVICK